jgi:hypothetical protein
MVKLVLLAFGIAVAIAVAALLASAAGFPISGGVIGGAVGGGVGVILIATSRGKTCPACAAELPRYRKPASITQALWGGWTCTSCGAEIDRHGRNIAEARA